MEESAEYLTLEDAAARIGRSKPTLWRLIKRFDIPTYRRPMDRRAYVKPADVDRIREVFIPRARAAV